jgi:hypothetical protein
LASVGNLRIVWVTVDISRCGGWVRWHKNLPNLPAVAYQAKSLGKSHCDGSDMPTVVPTIAQIATVGKIDAKSWQNLPNLDNQFLHPWMWYSTDCHIKMADF